MCDLETEVEMALGGEYLLKKFSEGTYGRQLFLFSVFSDYLRRMKHGLALRREKLADELERMESIPAAVAGGYISPQQVPGHRAHQELHIEAARRLVEVAQQLVQLSQAEVDRIKADIPAAVLDLAGYGGEPNDDDPPARQEFEGVTVVFVPAESDDDEEPTLH